MQKQEFLKNLMAGQDGECPCCGRYAKVYKRRLHGSAARQLIQLFKLGGAMQYVHTSQLLLPGETGVGDFTKAKYWGLIEEQENFNGKTRTSGMWALTRAGVEFVEGRRSIMQIAQIFDDRVLGFEGQMVGIKECLGEDFDYSRLMAA